MKSTLYKPYFSLILFVMIVSGCNSDEASQEPYPSTKLDGFYDLISMNSTTAVDLDHNTIFSTDIMMETHEQGNMSRYYTELNTEIYDWPGQPKFYHQRIFLWAPYTNAFFSDHGEYLYSEYGQTNLLAKYSYSEKTNTIDIRDNLGNGELISAQLSEDVLTIKFIQEYYTKNWEPLTIVAVYKKRN